MPGTSRLIYLLDQVKHAVATPEECEELLELINGDDTGDVVRQITSFHQQDVLSVTVHDKAYWETALEEVIAARRSVATPVRKVRSIYRWGWAAAVLACITIGAYLWQQPVSTQKPPVIAHTIHDIAPGTNKATLTLADGSIIPLDSAGNKVIQPGIQQQGSALLYDGDAAEVSYNTLTTPRGGQFQVQLPDGTKAWLNAASSLRYPTVFTGSERKVTITGEVYFEVMKQAEKPFKVIVSDLSEIEVLGTHFNVNAYNDEPAVYTTLLEGTVRVVHGESKVVLQPGQQAELSQSRPGIRTGAANVSQAVAWKNGLFDFHNKGLEEVMRQLTRWYDIEVIYEGKIPNIEFGGKVQRDLPLSKLLLFLEKSDVHFRLDKDRKLTVLP